MKFVVYKEILSPCFNPVFWAGFKCNFVWIGIVLQCNSCNRNTGVCLSVIVIKRNVVFFGSVAIQIAIGTVGEYRQFIADDFVICGSQSRLYPVVCKGVIGQ